MIEYLQNNRWRIVIPGGTMHKVLGDNKPYVVNLMCNSFKAFINYIQSGRFGLYENLSLKEKETVRKIAIGRRDIPLKLNLA